MYLNVIIFTSLKAISLAVMRLAHVTSKAVLAASSKINQSRSYRVMMNKVY